MLGDDEAGPVVVPVERPGVGAETRSRGEHPAAQAARELDVVYMLGFQVVLEVGCLRGPVVTVTDSALDRRHPIHLHSVDHTF